MTRDEYRAYLASDHWREFSQMIREEITNCEECGVTDTLNVHHRHYRTLWHEHADDVLVLCERCHYNTHILEQRMKMFSITDGDVVGGTFIDKRNAVQKKIEEIRGEKEGLNDVLARLLKEKARRRGD